MNKNDFKIKKTKFDFVNLGISSQRKIGRYAAIIAISSGLLGGPAFSMEDEDEILRNHTWPEFSLCRDYSDRFQNIMSRPMFEALRDNNIQKLTELLDAGESLEARNPYVGRTPLMEAAWYGSIDAVKFLLHRGADLTATELHGQNAVAESLWGAHCFFNYQSPKHIEVMEFLLQNGASSDNMSKEIENLVYPVSVHPLHTAARDDQKKLVDLFLKYNADINWQDQRGNTPVHTAAMYFKLEVLDTLFKAKPDLTITNMLGETVIDILKKYINDGQYNFDEGYRDTFLEPSKSIDSEQQVKLAKFMINKLLP